jgi:hypothetical protein
MFTGAPKIAIVKSVEEVVEGSDPRRDGTTLLEGESALFLGRRIRKGKAGEGTEEGKTAELSDPVMDLGEAHEQREHQASEHDDGIPGSPAARILRIPLF